MGKGSASYLFLLGIFFIQNLVNGNNKTDKPGKDKSN